MNFLVVSMVLSWYNTVAKLSERLISLHGNFIFYMMSDTKFNINDHTTTITNNEPNLWAYV